MGTNFSMWCFVGKSFSVRHQWTDAERKGKLWPTSQPRRRMFLPLQYRLCRRPWLPWKGRGVRSREDVIVLSEYADSASDVARGDTIVSPFVVSEPPWQNCC